MSELDKLQEYLKRKEYKFERVDRDSAKGKRNEWHQIIVYHGDSSKWFDAVCQPGSLGYQDGLLELMGPLSIMRPRDKYDSVEGYLTAQEIINRLETL